MKRALARRAAKLIHLILLVIAIGGVASPVMAEAIVITRFPVPTPNSGLNGITAGPDGNLWFTGTRGKIGRITPAGVITEFPIVTPGADPFRIVPGPDGALWFTEVFANRIGRITTDGQITEFSIPTPEAGPRGIAAGPDGNLWFAEFDANQIGRITPAGVITEFPVPTPLSFPFGIAAGSDGNLWFTEIGANQIGRITPAGAITEFPIPTPDVRPRLITAGPDGALWFSETIAPLGGILTAGLGRITPAGVISEFPLPTVFNSLNDLVVGPDGALWFTELKGFGRVTPAGAALATTITFITFAHPIVPDSLPRGIAAGPDGALWFAEENGNAIGRFSLTSLLGLSPGSGIYVTTQRLDPTVLLAPGLAVTGGRVTHNGGDVTAAVASCFTPGTLPAGGQSFRCTALGSQIGPGTHVFGVVLDLADGRSLSGGVTWEIFAASEP